MIFVPPKTHPDSYQWLRDHNPETLTYLDAIACARNYVEFFSEMGQSTQDPVRFLQAGDLQTFCNVVKDWPAMEGAPRKPNIADIMLSLRIIDPTNVRTFAQDLDFMWQRCRAWLADKNYDPDNPNETPKERQNRLAAARMRKWRGRLNERNIDDAEEMALVRKLREAQDNAKACRKYVRDQEAAAKTAYDAAVAQAKLARSATVSAAQAWVPQVDQAVVDAERALESYRINK